MNIGEILSVVKDVPDSRRQWGNIRHKLSEVLVLALCATMAGCQSFNEMEMFASTKIDFLRKFLILQNGTPDADTFRRILEKVSPDEFQKYLTNAQEVCKEKWQIVNIDGKTMRGSGNMVHNPYHVVSAYVSDKKMTLGQITVDEKSNEITAIPKLLDLIDIKGDVVTIDAMGCQREIARRIVEKNGDYVLAVKRNQPDLHDLIEDYYSACNDKPIHVEEEKNKGRIEKREYFLCTNTKWVDNGKWSNLQGVGCVKSTVEHKGETTTTTRYYITTLINGEKFANSVRGHWSIESMHWMLDVVFGEDKNRARKDHSAKNLNILRKTALTLLSKLDVGMNRPSMRCKMMGMALDPEKYLTQLFA